MAEKAKAAPVSAAPKKTIPCSPSLPRIAPTSNMTFSGNSPTIQPENIPLELRRLSRWVRWKLVNDGQTKPRKIPVRPATAECASTTDPATWGSFETAYANVGKHGTCGIGFVFVKGDGYVGIDVDNCIDEHGNLNETARDLVQRFNSYTEISPSGKGIHIIVKGKLPDGVRGIKKDGIEIYEVCRYFCTTGNGSERVQ